MPTTLIINRDSDPAEYAILGKDPEIAVCGKFDFEIVDFVAVLGKGAEDVHNVQLVSKDRFEVFASVCREL